MSCSSFPNTIKIWAHNTHQYLIDVLAKTFILIWNVCDTVKNGDLFLNLINCILEVLGDMFLNFGPISLTKCYKPRIWNNWCGSVCVFVHIFELIVFCLPSQICVILLGKKVKYKLKMKFRWEAWIIWGHHQQAHKYHPQKKRR